MCFISLNRTRQIWSAITVCLKLGVFGSVARNEAKKGSDIDMVVETQVPDLLRMVNLKEDIEKYFALKSRFNPVP